MHCNRKLLHDCPRNSSSLSAQLQKKSDKGFIKRTERLLRLVETCGLFVPIGHIWMTFDALLIQLLHHLSKPLCSHYESARVCNTVTSKVNGLARCHIISIVQSGSLPSCLANPTGFFMAGTPADARALATTSFGS